MTFHSIFKQPCSCWEELERKMESLPTQKEKGDAFEQFAFAYFTYFKDLYQIRELYMGPDIPPARKQQYHLEKKDSGVDGLFLQHDNSSVAYQVKFRSAQEAPSYDELTSFWAESEHTTQRCIFANCYTLPRQSYKKKNQFTILRDSLTALNESFFRWLHTFATTGRETAPIPKYTPLPHQQEIIDEVLDGFVHRERGKLLAACGTGKTLTALWIKEELHCRTTLFVAPNLALIRQTLESWMPQAQEPFAYLCVCSDQTVAVSPAGETDDPAPFHMDVPVTTDAEQIQAFLNYKTPRDKVIFSTYQSLDAIVAALQSAAPFVFDIAFFDEAHRTAGNKDSEMFILGMRDEFIPCRKRLFMTATERFVNPHIVGRAKQLQYDVFSMDNEEQYGTTFASLPFREAIERGIISDYKIVLCCMKENELRQIIQENQILQVGDRQVDAQTLFKQVLLAKTMEDIGIRKVISYHRNIASAREFIRPEHGSPLPDVIAGLSDTLDHSDIYAGHVNGSMPAGVRKEIFDAFIESPCGILSNARCLTEGVDVPIIDAVYFAEPKNSMIDIIQAVGRSLRKDRNNPDKVSYIIIPMVISDSVSSFKDIDPKEFSTLHAVIQALRDQDRILADYIDKLNLRAAKGKGRITQDPDAPILVELSQQLDVEDFADNLSLRITEVNKDPSRIEKEFIVNKTSRASGIKRTFRTVGDYNVDAYYRNLILPTLEKYPTFAVGLPRDAITIDHNNVSHCVKIGALNEKDLKFHVTDVGKAMFEFRDLWVDIFREQLLKYHELDPITRVPRFPYRMALRVIRQLGYITKFEFVYSLYIGRHFGTAGEQEAVERVEYLRSAYPNIEVLSEANKRIVLEALNHKFETTLKFEDIWTSRTTVYNQFTYIWNHLTSWDNIFDTTTPKNILQLLPQGPALIDQLLDKSSEIETCPLDSLRRHYTQYKGY
ncbi:MAG: DEAD/DEAH box helicase family protein [Eubacteriales bacterium]|jgi:superfamily II DNA or RNA helicase